MTARADLDVEAPTPAAAAVVGCRQRTLEFVLRAGRQRRRPSVDGRGCLVSLRKAPEEAAAGQTPPATPVALTNADAVAEAFRKALLPVIVETLQRRNVDRPKAPGEGMPIEEVVRKAEAHVHAQDGVFPGRNKLAEIVGCSPASITKAVKRSVYLRARKARLHDPLLTALWTFSHKAFQALKEIAASDRRSIGVVRRMQIVVGCPHHRRGDAVQFAVRCTP